METVLSEFKIQSFSDFVFKSILFLTQCFWKLISLYVIDLVRRPTSYELLFAQVRRENDTNQVTV